MRIPREILRFRLRSVDREFRRVRVDARFRLRLCDLASHPKFERSRRAFVAPVDFPRTSVFRARPTVAKSDPIAFPGFCATRFFSFFSIFPCGDFLSSPDRLSDDSISLSAFSHDFLFILLRHPACRSVKNFVFPASTFVFFVRLSRPGLGFLIFSRAIFSAFPHFANAPPRRFSAFGRIFATIDGRLRILRAEARANKHCFKRKVV